MSPLSELELELAALERDGLLRRPREVIPVGPAEVLLDGKPAVVFCSNDYLGLATDPRLVAACTGALQRYGVGAGASRLISGTTPAHRAAEGRLASFVGLPDALLFATGYAANAGTLSALLSRTDVAFSARLNHASLIDGLRLSRARVHLFDPHDLDALAASLGRHRSEGHRAWIVTDAVFSMDGDLAPLAELRTLADRFDAGLFVDEAHALGTLGDGRGLSHHLGVRPDVLVGTLGKAFGVAGAFVAGPPTLRTFLENRARSYVFSTAPPAMLAAATEAAVDLVERATEAREHLRWLTERLHSALRAQGWPVPDRSSTPILPVLVGDPARTMRLSAALLERGYFVQGVRPPTVPPGTSRLRVVPTAAHTVAQLDGLIEAFAALRSLA